MCKSVSVESEISQNSSNSDEKIVNFDEALSRTQFGKFNYFLVILSGAVLSAVLLETLSISFVLPVAEYDLNLTTKDKGILSSIAFAGIIASSHLWGYLADVKGRRIVIIISLLISFTFTLISSFVSNFWVFTAMRFLCGFFITGSNSTIYAYLGEFHDVKMRSRVVMGAAFVFGICCICLPLIALLIINQEWHFYISLLDIIYKPWRLFIASCGLLSLISGVCFIFLPESPKFVFSQGDEKKALEILRKVYEINTGLSSKNYHVKKITKENDDIRSDYDDRNENMIVGILRSMWKQTAPLFQKIHLKNTANLCFIQFLIFITSNGLYMFFPEILNRTTEFINENPQNSTTTTICRALDVTRPNISTELSSSVIKLEFATYQYTFILEIIYAIGFAAIGVLVNRLGKLIIIEFILLSCGICGIAIPFVSTTILSIYLYIILLACGLVVNVITSSTIELFPTNLRAMAISLSLMCGRLGSIFGSNIVGIFLDNYCESTFLFAGGALILGCILVFFIPNISYRETKANLKNNDDIEK